MSPNNSVFADAFAVADVLLGVEHREVYIYRTCGNRELRVSAAIEIQIAEDGAVRFINTIPEYAASDRIGYIGGIDVVDDFFEGPIASALSL